MGTSAHAAAFPLADMHCHLDFAPDAVALAQALNAQGIALFSTTVQPEDYAHVASLLEPCPAVRVGVGLHPWWVAVDTLDESLTCFDAFLKQAAVRATSHQPAPILYVGEVGLDFSMRHFSTRAAQEQSFRHIVQACTEKAQAGFHVVVSLHAVRAVTAVLDVLDALAPVCAAASAAQLAYQPSQPPSTGSISWILHWFSGSGDELVRARNRGCYFSVGQRMLATKRGRNYVSQIPLNRLLLETDLPEGRTPGADSLTNRHVPGAGRLTDGRTPGAGRLTDGCTDPSSVQHLANKMSQSLHQALLMAAECKNAEPADLAAQLYQNSARLLGLPAKQAECV